MYATWPQLRPYYAIPYVFGTLILLALALTSLDRSRSRVRRAAAWACVLVAFGTGAVGAANAAEEQFARREEWTALAAHLAARQAGAPVLVAADGGQDRAPGRLGRYVRMLWPDRAPRVERVRCDDVARESTRGSVTVVAFAHQCAGQRTRWPRPARSIIVPYTVRASALLAARQDTLRVDVWEGDAGRAPTRSP
jgi:hypothetical protein